MRAWTFQDSRQKQKLGDQCPWSVGWLDPDGKRRSKRVGAKSLAEKFRLKKETELAHGIASPRAVTWAEFRRQHTDAILDGMSPSNREATVIAFQHFERIINPKRMQTITTQTVDLYRTRRKREQARAKSSAESPAETPPKTEQGRAEVATVSLATVNKELRHLRAAFNIAHEWGMIAKAPKFTMEALPRRDPAFVDDAIFAKLYAACSTMARPVQTQCEPQEWWQALLTFAYLTGWRIGEILELRREDINYAEGVAFLPAEKTKGKRDIRVKLPEAVLEHVKRIQSLDELAFSWPHHRSTLHSDFRKLKAAAGVEFPGAFHRLRFGFANSNVDNLPADVLQHLMRHRSASTTRIYINDIERMRRQETGANVHVPAILRAGAAG
jgi:integrase